VRQWHHLSMPRQARVVAVGAPHHITQRGNNRQDVFLVDEDRLTYLQLLAQQSRSCGLALLGYCLMTNHVHLVAVPDQADSMARTLRRAHSRYAQWFNRRYHRSGHLWQGRYFSCSLGPDHLVTALAYVDLNPVRAGMVGWAEDYPWSSARAHVDGSDTRGVIDLAGWAEVRGITAWRETLRDPLSQQHAQTIRAATQVGAPLGAESFVAALEQQRGRPLKLRTRGRPPSTGMPRKTRSASAA
jgi:putative transposase